MPLSAAELLRNPSNDPKFHGDFPRSDDPGPFEHAARQLRRTCRWGTWCGKSRVRFRRSRLRQPRLSISTRPNSFRARRRSARRRRCTLTSGQERSGIDFSLKPVEDLARLRNGDGPGRTGGTRRASAGAGRRRLQHGDGHVGHDDGCRRAIHVPRRAGWRIRDKSGPHPQARPGIAGDGDDDPGRGPRGTTIITTSPAAGATPLPLPAEPTLWATVPVGVGDTDVSDVMVVLRPGARVSGRIEFDGIAERPDPARMQRIPIVVERADRLGVSPFQSIPPGRVDVSGTFNTYGVPAGQYFDAHPRSARAMDAAVGHERGA